MEKQELKKILTAHRRYLAGDDTGLRAELNGMDLSGFDLSCAVLRAAHLRRVNFQDANLSGADLEGADLRDAIFFGANLTGARIKNMDLGLYSVDQAFFDQTLIMPDGIHYDRHTHDLWDLTFGRRPSRG